MADNDNSSKFLEEYSRGFTDGYKSGYTKGTNDGSINSFEYAAKILLINKVDPEVVMRATKISSERFGEIQNEVNSILNKSNKQLVKKL